MNENETSEFQKLFTLGLDQLTKTSTGYEIIHAGKKADTRVLKKLGLIAKVFTDFDSYPKIESTHLQIIINKALGSVDDRTYKKYRKTILDYCNYDEEIIEKCDDNRFGILDVSRFVKRIPTKYVVGSID